MIKTVLTHSTSAGEHSRRECTTAAETSPRAAVSLGATGHRAGERGDRADKIGGRQHVLISRITDDFSRFVDVQSTRNAWHLFSIFSLLPTLLVWETPSWTPPAAKATERAQKCIVESMDGESEARAATKNEVQIDSKALSFEEMIDNLFQGARANVNDDGKQKQKKQRMSLARAQAKAQAHANGLVHALAAPLPVHGAHKETTHIQSSTQFR